MTDAVRTTTLEELVDRCAFRLGDAVFIQTTKAGTVTELYDQVNIPLGNEQLQRRQIVFTSGTDGNPRGVVKLITDTNPTAHSLTFTPEMGSLIAQGVTATIINKRGQGFSYLEYKKAINMAIDDAYPIYRELVVGATAVFNSDSPTLSIGTTLNEVYAVQYQDDAGDWWPISQASHMAYPGWQSNPYSNQVVINDLDLRDSINGMTVRVLGEGKPAALTTHTSTTRIHPEWLVSRACYHLCLMGMDRDITGLRSKQVLTFQAEAEQRMTLIRTRREPSSLPTRSS